jgi:hypothetical protein
MGNLLTLCVLGILALVGLAILIMVMRSFGGAQGRGYNQYGPEQPRYDDPNVRSRGWFGGRGSTRGGETPHHDSPDVQSRGWFGSGRRSGGSSSGKPSGGSYHSPNVKSGGSFGGKK